MKTPLEEFIVTQENRNVFDCVSGITGAHEAPQRIFLVGAADSGKTTLLRAREIEKDLLSTKRVLYRPCAELAEAMRANVYDGFFEDLGTHEVLLLDDFDGFLEDEEMGPLLCKLLLKERSSRGLDTIITSTKPISEYNSPVFEDVLSEFTELVLGELDSSGKTCYVKSLIEEYFEEEKSPKLEEAAIEYVANGLNQPPSMIRKAVYFLMKEYSGEPGVMLTLDQVKKALL